jgi:hypothetical protein
MTGTATSVRQRCRSTSASVFSGSKRRARTNVDDRATPKLRWPNPHEWNSGAAISARSRTRSGIAPRSAAMDFVGELGTGRDAPFGAPVVPEVRITAVPGCAGGRCGEGSPSRIRSSSDGSPVAPPSSRQATNAARAGPASPSTAPNSSS